MALKSWVRVRVRAEVRVRIMAGVRVGVRVRVRASVSVRVYIKSINDSSIVSCEMRCFCSMLLALSPDHSNFFYFCFDAAVLSGKCTG
jgi:hypothetical protein